MIALRDKYGWPTELIIGRPVTNFIRLLIHTNIRMTWKYRKVPNQAPAPDRSNYHYAPAKSLRPSPPPSPAQPEGK